MPLLTRGFIPLLLPFQQGASARGFTPYGKRLLKYVKAMFADIHRQDELTEIEFERLMYQHKKAIMKTVRRFVPEHKKAAVLAKRFAEHGESYFLFVEDTALA